MVETHTSPRPTWTWPSFTIGRGYHIFGSGPRWVTSLSRDSSNNNNNNSMGMTEMNIVAVMIGSVVLLLHVCGWMYMRLPRGRDTDRKER